MLTIGRAAIDVEIDDRPFLFGNIASLVESRMRPLTALWQKVNAVGRCGRARDEVIVARAADRVVVSEIVAALKAESAILHEIDNFPLVMDKTMGCRCAMGASGERSR